jgi:hypothetical protein
MSAQILKNANMRWIGSLGQDVGVQVDVDSYITLTSYK